MGTRNWISTLSVVTSSSIVRLSVVRIFCNFLTAAIMDVSRIFLGIFVHRVSTPESRKSVLFYCCLVKTFTRIDRILLYLLEIFSLHSISVATGERDDAHDDTKSLG